MNNAATPATQEVMRVGQIEVRYLQEAGNGRDIGCFEMRVPPGSNVPPPHSHSLNEELIYILDGTLRCTVDGETRDLKSGEAWGTPRGVVHGFSNPHTVEARALVILTPDVGPEYFREIGAIVNAGGPPDREKVAAWMKKFGLTPATTPHVPQS